MTKRSINALDAARWIMITLLVAVLFSPPIVNLMQALLLVLFISSPELRNRIVRACRQPMVIGVLAFYLVICIGVFYSIADTHATLKMWGGWRKLLLLPLAVALFDDTVWKLRLLFTLISITMLCVIASYIGVLSGFHFPVSGGGELGVLVRNHSTQGMVFAVSSFVAAILALFWNPLSQRNRLLLSICAILAASNVIFVTTGRSGYVVLIVCSIFLAIGWCFHTRTSMIKKIVGSAAFLTVLFLSLLWAPSSHQHIMQGIKESQGQPQQPNEGTAIGSNSEASQQKAMMSNSMGIRRIFWKHTIPMLTERPLFGYGTGAFYTAYKNYVSNMTGVDGIATGDPHNQYMKIAGEHGLLGLMVFLGFLASSLKQRASMPFRLLGLGVLAAWCATGLVNSHFSTFNEGVFIYVWLGAMLAEEHDNRHTA